KPIYCRLHANTVTPRSRGKVLAKATCQIGKVQPTLQVETTVMSCLRACHLFARNAILREVHGKAITRPNECVEQRFAIIEECRYRRNLQVVINPMVVRRAQFGPAITAGKQPVKVFCYPGTKCG